MGVERYELSDVQWLKIAPLLLGKVMDTRPIRLDHAARPPLAHPQHPPKMRDRFSPARGRHHFFDRGSFSPALSSMASTSSRFSFAFSSSSARSRFASEISRPPYFAFQA